MPLTDTNLTINSHVSESHVSLQQEVATDFLLLLRVKWEMRWFPASSKSSSWQRVINSPIWMRHWFFFVIHAFIYSPNNNIHITIVCSSLLIVGSLSLQGLLWSFCCSLCLRLLCYTLMQWFYARCRCVFVLLFPCWVTLSSFLRTYGHFGCIFVCSFCRVCSVGAQFLAPAANFVVSHVSSRVFMHDACPLSGFCCHLGSRCGHFIAAFVIFFSLSCCLSARWRFTSLHGHVLGSMVIFVVSHGLSEAFVMSGLFVVVVIKQRPFGRSQSVHFQKPLRQEHNKSCVSTSTVHTLRRQHTDAHWSQQDPCSSSVSHAAVLLRCSTPESLQSATYSGWGSQGAVCCSRLLLQLVRFSVSFWQTTRVICPVLSSSVQTENASLEEEAG